MTPEIDVWAAMTPRTAARTAAGRSALDYYDGGRLFEERVLAIEAEAGRYALLALRFEVVKLDDLRRDVQTAEAMNRHVLALIDDALAAESEKVQ